MNAHFRQNITCNFGHVHRLNQGGGAALLLQTVGKTGVTNLQTPVIVILSTINTQQGRIHGGMWEMHPPNSRFQKWFLLPVNTTFFVISNLFDNNKPNALSTQ